MGALSAACMAVAMATNIGMMYAFKLLVDSLAGLSAADPWQAAQKPFVIVALCCLVHNILHRIRTFANGYSTPDVESRLREVMMDSLRASIAVIPQDPSLFHRSLRDNIAYENPIATEEQVIEAAKAAQAHDFIMALPDRYDTLVGERGVKLSGGQRQRIAIARAILKNAPVLLLDEATSALDSQTERALQAAFHTAMEGRTTLVVAHRLSTLAHLDRILVMDNGQIVEDGPLSGLLAMDGHFARLWRLQADGFLPEKL